MDRNLQEAMNKVRILKVGYTITGCLDFGTYWAFSCKPDNGRKEYDGICCIDKKTLTEKYVNPMGNPSEFIKGKPTKID